MRVRRFDIAERRARLGRRHHLARRAAQIETVAHDLIGFHATDPVSVFLSARARVAGLRPPDVEAALYEGRTLVRLLGMRRTMFVVPREHLPLVEAAAGRDLGAAERRRVGKWLEQAGLADDGQAWLSHLEDEVEATLDAAGEMSAAELAKLLPALQTKIPVAEGTSYATTVGLGSRVLLLLAMDGRVVRGRPRGSWVSAQYRWTTMRRWLGGDLELPPADEAAADLARHWLRGFGPATINDLKWWTGWTVARTRRAIADVGAVDVDLDGTPGIALPDDLEPTPAPQPWVALLPALDATVMGWKQRDWYLGEHRAALFDRNGNAGPTVWCDGRVVGGWAQRATGQIAVHLLEDVGTQAQAAVQTEAEALADWFGDVRITPKFRTPLERELAALPATPA